MSATITRIDITESPSKLRATQESGQFTVEVDIDTDSSGGQYLKVEANLYSGTRTASGSPVAAEKKGGLGVEVIDGAFSAGDNVTATFSPFSWVPKARTPGQYPEDVNISVSAKVWQKSSSSQLTGKVDDEQKSNTVSGSVASVQVLEPIESTTPGADTDTSDNPLSQTFDNRQTFAIEEIILEGDANRNVFDEDELIPQSNTESEITSSIDKIQSYKISDFKYPNPNISVDTSARFIKHEIIGGPVVRQKIGEDAAEYSIDGICTEEKAIAIDELRNAKRGKLKTSRLPGSGRQSVQFASASTDPIAEGDGAALDSGEILYTFSLSCVEAPELSVVEGQDT